MLTSLAGMTGTTPATPVTQTNQPTSSSQSPVQQLGANAFLQLLTTELQNQDPLQPMSDTQSVAQLAQFSTLQAQNQLDTSFENFQSNFGVLQASTLIGKSVTVVTPNGTGNSSTVTGTVASISVQNGAPYFSMNDASGNPIADSNGQPLLFSTGQIVGIGG